MSVRSMRRAAGLALNLKWYVYLGMWIVMYISNLCTACNYSGLLVGELAFGKLKLHSSSYLISIGQEVPAFI